MPPCIKAFVADAQQVFAPQVWVKLVSWQTPFFKVKGGRK